MRDLGVGHHAEIEAAKAAGMKAVLYDPNQVYAEFTGVKKIQHFSEVLRCC